MPDILKTWDEAHAKADAEEAAEAELHREIDARKRGNDRLSTIEAVYVLAERDMRAAALPSTQGPTPSALQPGAAPRPDAGMFREGAVTPALPQIPSMPAGTGGIDDILTLGPFALLAHAHRGSFAAAQSADRPRRRGRPTSIDRRRRQLRREAHHCELQSQVLFRMIDDKASVCEVMHWVATTGRLPPGCPIQAGLPMPRS